MLRLAPAVTLAAFLLPIGAGLIGTILPAFGFLPALGRSAFSLAPWRELFATPGLATTVRLTVTVGFGATLISAILAAGFCALTFQHPWLRRLERSLPPLLATPHVALAIGFAFLIAPSGWIVRVLSPELSGWDRPPDLATVRDPHGLSFMAGLVLKEAPYLVLMMLGATGQIGARPLMAAAGAMGYAGPTAWAKVVLPQIYRQVRLPIYAVLAFSLSVVEVGLVLAPGHPPPLSVLLARWFAGSDLDLYFPAAAGAVLQLLVVVAGIAVWRLAELAIVAAGRDWLADGGRRGATGLLLSAAGWTAIASGVASLASACVLVLWSFAGTWRFPDDLPSEWTLSNWGRLASLDGPTLATIVIGLGSSLVAVALALACLENETRRGLRPGANALWLLYLPLLVPPIAFLFGVQVLLVRMGLDATLLAVAWAHLLFVLPYVFLSLADPYRALDPRYAQIAAGLGVRPWQVFVRVKLPILLRPLLVAFAVGFAVSVGQYLPTVFAGAGRVSTLTTEAVTLSSGADRRVVGVATVVQTALPLLVYGLALAVPALLYRGRRGLR